MGIRSWQLHVRRKPTTMSIAMRQRWTLQADIDGHRKEALMDIRSQQQEKTIPIGEF